MKTSHPHWPGWAILFSIMVCVSAFAGPKARPEPPSEEEKIHWRAHGRILPEPETLQPTLDKALITFAPRADIELSIELRGTTSDVLTDLAGRWTKEFKRYYPNVSISLSPPFAGSLGARELIKGDLDFVLVSRELRPDDITDFKAKFGYAPFVAPILGGTWRHFGFLDAVVFFVHEDNPLSKLTFAQLDALLSVTLHSGEKPVRTWTQLGVGGEWADKKIHVWGIKPWNGFEEFVRQRVLSKNDNRGEWREDINLVKTVFPVSDEVAKDRYAIGYAGLAYVGPGVKLLALAGGGNEPFVAPEYEAVALAQYPLSRMCYITYNRKTDQATRLVLDEFMRFLLSREGQQTVLEQGVFLPLRSWQAEASRSLLD